MARRPHINRCLRQFSTVIAKSLNILWRKETYLTKFWILEVQSVVLALTRACLAALQYGRWCQCGAKKEEITWRDRKLEAKISLDFSIITHFQGQRVGSAGKGTSV